jgi:hypothetical protein
MMAVLLWRSTERLHKILCVLFNPRRSKNAPPLAVFADIASPVDPHLAHPRPPPYQQSPPNSVTLLQ